MSSAYNIKSFSELDYMPGVKWLVSGIEDIENKICFSELVLNILPSTLYDVMIRNVCECYLIMSDDI